MKYFPLFFLAMPVFGETLHVYTYDSFASEWGPGPKIEAGFEEACGCDLEFVTAGDGGALLSRLKLEGKNSAADVVLGIDQNLWLRREANSDGLFIEHGLPSQDISGADFTWSDPHAVAYDWGHFAFVYRKDEIANPPKSFEELAESDLDIVIQDPRSSTPGLGLAVWISQVEGDGATQTWQALGDNIVTITPGWSEAYSLFLEGEADMALSYSTSPAYHAIAEGDDGFAYAPFDAGHAGQIELAAIVASSDQPDLARAFLTYLQSAAAQRALMEGNWMYPVEKIDLPVGFAPPDAIKMLPLPSNGESIERALAAFQAR